MMTMTTTAETVADRVFDQLCITITAFFVRSRVPVVEEGVVNITSTSVLAKYVTLTTNQLAHLIANYKQVDIEAKCDRWLFLRTLVRDTDGWSFMELRRYYDRQCAHDKPPDASDD